MVSYNVYRSTSSGAYVEGVCLASDEKPVVGIANGSILYAVDASNGETTRYMYDKESMAWIEAECPCAGGSGSGSGSGGGSVEPLIVNESRIDETHTVLDKTWKEINDAMAVGQTVFIVGVSRTSFSETRTQMSLIMACVEVSYEGDQGTQYQYEVRVDNETFVTDSETGYPGTDYS